MPTTYPSSQARPRAVLDVGGGFGGPPDGGHYAGIMNGNLSMNILIVKTRPVSGQANTISTYHHRGADVPPPIP